MSRVSFVERFVGLGLACEQERLTRVVVNDEVGSKRYGMDSDVRLQYLICICATGVIIIKLLVTPAILKLVIR